jgi:hypothetical protein
MDEMIKKRQEKAERHREKKAQSRILKVLADCLLGLMIAGQFIFVALTRTTPHLGAYTACTCSWVVLRCTCPERTTT